VLQRQPDGLLSVASLEHLTAQAPEVQGDKRPHAVVVVGDDRYSPRLHCRAATSSSSLIEGVD
jgi:hypothetical protein